MSGFIVNRPLQPGDVLQTREQAVQQAPDTQGAGYGELCERYRIMLGDDTDFDNDGFQIKRGGLRQLLTAIQTLTAENERLTAMIEGVGSMALADQETTISQQARIAELEAEVAAASAILRDLHLDIALPLNPQPDRNRPRYTVEVNKRELGAARAFLARNTDGGGK
jgi:hypothetical protein